MANRSWTELFFLDEAVALAAGHRPCFFCRRDDAKKFRAAWAGARGQAEPSVSVMDAVLHGERMERGRKWIHPVPGPLCELPDGTVIAASGSAYTIADGRAFRWTEDGYEPSRKLLHAEGMLTPPSTFLALRAGYRPILHPMIAILSSDQHHRPI
jgi:hypothetical protein